MESAWRAGPEEIKVVVDNQDSESEIPIFQDIESGAPTPNSIRNKHFQHSVADAVNSAQKFKEQDIDESRRNSFLIAKNGQLIGVKNRKLDNAHNSSNKLARAHMSVSPRDENGISDESHSYYDGCRSMQCGELSEISGDGDFPQFRSEMVNQSVC